MNHQSPITSNEGLRDGLLSVADLWASATDRSVGALSSIVANHGGAIERLRDPSKTLTTATLEKFAGYLADPANWPGGDVPVEAVEFAHRVGVSAPVTLPSPGKASDLTPNQESAA